MVTRDQPRKSEHAMNAHGGTDAWSVTSFVVVLALVVVVAVVQLRKRRRK
jgi:hypothetical protein